MRWPATALSQQSRASRFASIEDEVVRNPAAPLVADLDALPFPAFHLFPDVRYCRHFPLELGRGCPFSCTFCSTNDFFRRNFRLKSPAQMIADMRRVKQTYGINSFELVHDMFTVDRKRVVAFCEALLECKRKDPEDAFIWGCSARTDCVDEELIELMSRAGCRGIFFGIETGSKRMQKIIDKGLELNDSAERVRSCDKFKINTAVSLMAGFPDETMNDLRDTAAFFVDSLRYDHADPQLSILAPLARTPITTQHKDALVLNDDVADMSYRGWRQEIEDHAMIAAHPEIFSSFYSAPLPHLDREFLKELRDFLLSGMRAFRRLLLGLHQDSGNVVDVFQQWQEWRTETEYISPTATAPSTTRKANFPRTLFALCGCITSPPAKRLWQSPRWPITKRPCWQAIAATVKSRSSDEPVFQDSDDLLSPDSRLRLLPGVKVIELPADYQEILRRLRQRSPLHEVPSRQVKLAIRSVPARPAEVRQLTPALRPIAGSLCRRIHGPGDYRRIPAA